VANFVEANEIEEAMTIGDMEGRSALLESLRSGTTSSNWLLVDLAFDLSRFLRSELTLEGPVDEMRLELEFRLIRGASDRVAIVDEHTKSRHSSERDA